MDDEQQQLEFLAALVALTEKYSAYGTPKVYSDGDIIIRLDPAMKKKLQRLVAVERFFFSPKRPVFLLAIATFSKMIQSIMTTMASSLLHWII